jgi:hypothetical protein
MSMMIRHVERIAEPELVRIRRSATEFRESLAYDVSFGAGLVTDR